MGVGEVAVQRKILVALFVVVWTTKTAVSWGAELGG